MVVGAVSDSENRSASSNKRSRGRPISIGIFSVSIRPTSSSRFFLRENVALLARSISSLHRLISNSCTPCFAPASSAAVTSSKSPFRVEPNPSKIALNVASTSGSNCSESVSKTRERAGVRSENSCASSQASVCYVRAFVTNSASSIPVQAVREPAWTILNT